MGEWTEDEITAHIAFQRHVGDLLRERGEFVDAQALSPERYRSATAGRTQPRSPPMVRYRRLGRAAGRFMIDVESEARAHEVAAHISAPGKDGQQPICEWIEVRPVMRDAPANVE